jgi:hypothetical protein
MAGIGDMRIEREGADMLFNLPEDGRVGIGTNSPTSALHVVNDNGNTIFAKSEGDSHGRGIVAVSEGASGRGVYGAATSMTGTNTGVYGESWGSTGRGVFGFAAGSGGETTGVYGLSHSSNGGRGVFGWATAHGGTTYGVRGLVNSPDGYAGYFTGPSGSRNYFEQAVGIGTDSPTAHLHVERTSSSSIPQARIHNSSATGFARFRLTNDAHEHYWEIASGGTNNYLDFYHNGNGGSMMTLRPDLRFVGIRTINPTFTLHVNGDAGKPGGGSWANASDARLKSDVQDLQGSLENLLKLRGVTFIYNDPETIHELPGKRTGMIAQEVAEVFPDWVSEANDGYLRLTYRGFEALTVEAFRELKAEISRLSNENEKLKVEKDIEIARLSCRLHAIENLLSRIYQEQKIQFSQND